jgi:hypothetical protein
MNIKLKTLIEENLFSHEIEDLDLRKIENKIDAPYASVKISELGGRGRESLFFTISLDDKTTWPGGIFQNSRYVIFVVNNDNNTLELVNKYYKINEKFRKTKVKDVSDAIQKINAYIKSIK